MICFDSETSPNASSGEGPGIEGAMGGEGTGGGGGGGRGGNYSVLLTRFREERLFELRHLQHGVRTVSREVSECMRIYESASSTMHLEIMAK